MMGWFLSNIKIWWDTFYGKLGLAFISGSFSYSSTIEYISNLIGPTMQFIVMIFGAIGVVLGVCNAAFDLWKKFKAN